MNTNKELIKKVDTFVSDLDGGELIGDQAAAFIQDAVDAAVLQKFCRTVTIPNGKRTIPRMGFGTRILRAATEGQALPEAQRAKVDIDSITLEPMPFVATVRLTYEAMEKNIEKWGVENSIKKAMAQRIGIDVDDLVMNSNTASLDPFYKHFNGMRALAGGGIDLAGAAYGKDVMKEMMKTLPKAFKNDRSALAYFASLSSAENYQDELSGRATTLGDKYLEGSAPMYFNGARVIDSSVIPEDLGIAPNFRTEAILCDPRNAIVAYKENVTFETDKDIEARLWIIVATIWVTFGFEQPAGAVRGWNIGL
ncbi:MAG: hypothetical protein Q7U75_19425 [Desulfobacterales bacterium]|nr:hypothetical protein [Desulfobacterales bacterium]